MEESQKIEKKPIKAKSVKYRYINAMTQIAYDTIQEYIATTEILHPSCVRFDLRNGRYLYVEFNQGYIEYILMNPDDIIEVWSFKLSSIDVHKFKHYLKKLTPLF